MTRMPILTRFGLTAAAALLAASCSSAPAAAPATPAPQPMPAASPQVPNALTPPQSAERAADHVTLTGVELGTMWTFENPPLDYWRETYNFDATPEWLEHARLSSVRWSQGCSASFVSPDGLVVTNHHCARACVDAVSQGDEDLLSNGFYAATQAEERSCPNLSLDQLVEIQDVTDRVQGAAPANAPATQVAAAQEAERNKIKEECEGSSDYSCQVVTLYHGGQYQLYKYKTYDNVKLVMAPELQAGFFGGDYDNFTYPRYDTDFSFVRAYNDDDTSPASTPNYFRWRAEGADEGELLFVTGNPGSTSRQITVAQWLYEMQFRHPFYIDLLEGQEAYLKEMGAQDPQVAARVRNRLFGVENSLKLFRGELEGLQDTLLMARKIKWQRQLQQAIQADPQLKAQFAGVIDSIATLETRKYALAPRLNLANPFFLGTPYMAAAGALVTLARENALPEGERMDTLYGQPVQRLQMMAMNPQLGEPGQESTLLKGRLQMAADWLSAGDPLRDALLAATDVDQALQILDRATGIQSTTTRQDLLNQGIQKIGASQDPYLQMAVVMDSIYRSLEPRWAELQAAESVQQERFAKALFGVFGTQIPPDATFTLRISDGVLKRYPYNGTIAAPFTTFHGLYERAEVFNNEDPFTLPASFAKAKDTIDMDKRLDFVSTNDITGGNSGSPIIDRQARIVGLAFDGNVEQLPNEFLFRPDSSGRTVGVDTQAITEALKSVYKADRLLKELMDAANR